MANNNQREYLTIKKNAKHGETMTEHGNFIDEILAKAAKRDELRDEPVITKSQSVFDAIENDE